MGCLPMNKQSITLRTQALKNSKRTRNPSKTSASSNPIDNSQLVMVSVNENIGASYENKILTQCELLSKVKPIPICTHKLSPGIFPRRRISFA